MARHWNIKDFYDASNFISVIENRQVIKLPV